MSFLNKFKNIIKNSIKRFKNIIKNSIKRFKNSMQQDVKQFQKVNNELPLKNKIILYVISILFVVILMASIIFIKDYRITLGIAFLFLMLFFYLQFFKKNKSRF